MQIDVFVQLITHITYDLRCLQHIGHLNRDTGNTTT
ncbi:Uncharacterised protein [Vibrio cholerae]|nr:Uncharacterised protein [Vibrio cholerae]CSI75560.1 Uncharacterised protein [Vibrio cholerae]